MLHVPAVPEYLWYFASMTGQPVATFGTLITPAQNAYGSYTELAAAASVTEDVWRIRVNVVAGNVGANIRDMLLTIGFDPAGGTAYVDTLTHLLVSDAQAYLAGTGGVSLEFPFFIPAGSSIAGKASVNNATVGTVRCWLQLWGRPRYPEITPLGRIFRSFGAVTASSRGTIVTPGTTSEGAWAQLGSALVEPLWWWEVGYGCGDATMNASVLHADVGIGDATNKRMAISDLRILQTGTETISRPPGGTYFSAAPGDLVYGRLQEDSAPDTDHSLIAYGVGG